MCLALEDKIDMTYPLTPLPLASCHLDGTLWDTLKSKLSNVVKSSIQSSEPKYVDVYIIDGNFYLYLQTDLPATFFGVLEKFLKIMHTTITKNWFDFQSDTMSSN